MESNYSLADIRAATEGDGFGFGGNSGMWIVLLIILLGGGGFGYNRGYAEPFARQEDVFNVDKDVLKSSCMTDSKVDQARYDTLLGFKDAQAQMASCCCDLKTAIHGEGEATRALITQNRIADLEKELNQAQTIISNTAQTNYILNSLGRYVTNPATPIA